MTDNSVLVDPNAEIMLRSTNESGQEFPIGNTVVKVTATDEAGNMAACYFLIEVRGNYYTGESWFIYNIYLSHTVSDGATKTLVLNIERAQPD